MISVVKRLIKEGEWLIGFSNRIFCYFEIFFSGVLEMEVRLVVKEGENGDSRFF